MKKSASLLLALLLALFSFTACGGEEESSSVVSSTASAPPSSSSFESSMPSSSLPESFLGEGVSVEDSEWQDEEWECYYEIEYVPGHISHKVCYLVFRSERDIKIGFSLTEAEPDNSYEGTYYWDEDKLVIDVTEVFRGIFEEEIENPATLHTVLQVEDNGDLTYTVTLVEGDPLHPYHEYGVPETYYHRKLMFDPNPPITENLDTWDTFIPYNDDQLLSHTMVFGADGQVEAYYGIFESEPFVAYEGEYYWENDTFLHLELIEVYRYTAEEPLYGDTLLDPQSLSSVLSVEEVEPGIFNVLLVEGDSLHAVQNTEDVLIYYSDKVPYNPYTGEFVDE